MAVKRTAKRRRSASRSAGGRPAVVEEVEAEEIQEEDVTLFDSGGADKVVYIWRINPTTKRLVFLFKLLPEEATEEEVQRLAGGGTYTCREKGRNDDGVMVFGKNRTIEIGGPPREPKVPKGMAEELQPTGSPPGVVVESRGKTTLDDVLTGGILRLFTSQAEASETQAKMYQAMAMRPQMDWTELMKAVAPLLLTLLAKKDDGPNPMEMVTQIAAMVKDSSSPTTQFKDMLETVDSVFSIKEQAAGPPADPLTALAGTLPKILEIISSEQKTKGRMPTKEEVQRRLAAPSPAAAGGQMPVYQALLKKFTPMMVRWAREGKDPGLMGEFLFNSIPEKYHGAVREFLLREDAEELVYQTAPDLRAFPQWTQDCFGTLAEAFGITEEEEEEEEKPDVIFEVGSDGVGKEVIEETTEETETVEE